MERLKKLKNYSSKMKPIYLVFQMEKKQSRTSLKLIAVCSSYRAGTSLVVEQLLKAGKIEPKTIGKYRDILMREKRTKDFDKNYIIEETPINTELTIYQN